MLSKINLACVGALTLLPHLAVAADAADRLPAGNIERICRDAQSAALPGVKATAFQSCVNDERKAFNELRQKWARYSANDRVSCAEPDDAPVSYVELQTCLDMQPGGSLAVEGPGPGAAPSLNTMASPAPVGRSPGGSNDRAATRIGPPLQTEQSARRVAPYSGGGASTP
jgi:hypothetical protein